MFKRLSFLFIFAIPLPLLANEAELASCAEKMGQLALAFHNHHDTYGKHPPLFTVDANGKPLHSWRVLILPYLGRSEAELYRQIRLDEPWNSAYNKQFHSKMPEMFRCPVSTLGDTKRDTIYCMVVGKETMGVPDGQGIQWNQITDGTSNTILLVERKTPVCWMEPVDVLLEHAVLEINTHDLGIGSEHPGGAIIGFADAATYFMNEGIDLEILELFLVRDSRQFETPEAPFPNTVESLNKIKNTSHHEP
ncbi:MAG: DUF1559 domain-containing protein [Planctomycetaceae bacterium]|nr:DUF1559 domain-containing protein [Planctomycetaceae bacterium]